LRLNRLADLVEKRPKFGRAKASVIASNQEPPANCLVGEAEKIISTMEDIAAGHKPPDVFQDKPEEKGKSGFFVKDAFANADYAKFAFKGTLAVLICYLTFNLLDWP